MEQSTKKILLLRDVIDAVRTFHDAFGVENAEKPTLTSIENFTLRYKLMREENEEYLEACEQENLVEVADALGDMLYIWAGTVLKHGLHDKMEMIFEEIQKSNMSKLDENGKPLYREDGKVLKGPQFFPPSIQQFVEA